MNRRQRKAASLRVTHAQKSEQVVQIPSNLSVVPDRRVKISVEDVLTLRARGQAKQKIKAQAKSTDELFAAYEPPKCVLPAGKTGKKIAMDAGFSVGNAVELATLGDINAAFDQGYAFLGFQVLAQLSQIPEYRRPTEVFAREMTRKWLTFKAVGTEDKSERIAAIEAEFKRLNVEATFRKAIEHDGFFGRAHIFLDMGFESDIVETDELKTELVESPAKIGIGQLKRLTVIEPMWIYPNRYNANDPTDPIFYKPTTWFCMAKEIHSSRMLTIVTRELPDILKPSYSFAGLSLSQMIKPYVDNWLRTRQSVSDLIHAFTVWTLSTDMSAIQQMGGADNFYNRLELFNIARDNHGVNAINKDTEEFSNVSAPLGGLDKLQAQAQEQMCAPLGQPLVYLTGITPAGLNASSQDEIEVFQDTIAANQKIYTPFISRLMNIVQLSLFGDIDPDIGFEWNQLKVMTEVDSATLRKTEAETDQLHIDGGVISPEEVRYNLANQGDSRYAGLDLHKEITPASDPSIDPELMGHANQ